MGRNKKRLIGFLVLAALLAAAELRAAAPEPQRLRLEVSADIDYDTNASNQTSNPVETKVVPQRSSMVYTQALKAEYNFFPAGPFNIQAKYDFFQNFRPRISIFDTLMHTWTLTPSYSFGQYQNMKFWLPFAFNYTDVGSDKYYTSFSLNPNFFHRYSQLMGYALEMRLNRRYGWIPQFFPGLFDYTSRSMGGSLGYYLFTTKKGGYVQARVSYDYTDARGSNNDTSLYRLQLSGEYPFTSRFNALLYLELGLAPHDHRFRQGNAPDIFDNRKDRILTLGVAGYYTIYQSKLGNVVGSLHYYFTREDSNIGLYDYTKHVIGGQLAYRY